MAPHAARRTRLFQDAKHGQGMMPLHLSKPVKMTEDMQSWKNTKTEWVLKQLGSTWDQDRLRVGLGRVGVEGLNVP